MKPYPLMQYLPIPRGKKDGREHSCYRDSRREWHNRMALAPRRLPEPDPTVGKPHRTRGWRYGDPDPIEEEMKRLHGKAS